MATLTETATLCRNYVNGRWVESKSPKIVERRNPANTDEVVARIPLSTREEMKEAIAAAKAAFPGVARHARSRARQNSVQGSPHHGRAERSSWRGCSRAKKEKR